MGALKQIASKEDLALYRKSTVFCKSFMKSVRRHGRVRELEFMTRYFSSMKNPIIPLRFASLGLKLIKKGKIPLQIPIKGYGPLGAIFRKTSELEEQR